MDTHAAITLMVLKRLLLIFILFVSSFAYSNSKLLKVRKKIVRSIKKSAFYKPSMSHSTYKKYLKKLARKRKPKGSEAKLIKSLGEIEAALVLKSMKSSLRNSALNNLYFANKYKVGTARTSSFYSKLQTKKKKKKSKKKKNRNDEEEVDVVSSSTKKNQKRFSIGIGYTSWQEDRKLIEGGNDKEVFNTVVGGPTIVLNYELMHSKSGKLSIDAGYQLGKANSAGDTFTANDIKTSTISGGVSYLFKIKESFYLGLIAKFFLRSIEYPAAQNQVIEEPSLKTGLGGLRFNMDGEKFDVYTEVGYGMAFSSPYFGFGFTYLAF